MSPLCVGIDVTDDSSLKRLIEKLEGRNIDLLIIAAGSQETDKLDNVTKDNIRRQMESNAIGPLFTIKALQSKLQKGSKVVYSLIINSHLQRMPNTLHPKFLHFGRPLS